MAQEPVEVSWTTIAHPALDNRPIHLAATKFGLCQVTLPHESFETMRAWTKKKIPNAVLLHDPARMSEYTGQLQAYFDGELTAFTFPIDYRGTEFQKSVWRELARIPYGEIRSYSDIASGIGSPNAIRAVGTANGANPIPIVVPCHRVIGKNNALTGFRGGLNMKETLLRLEGFREFTSTGHERYRF